MQRETTALVILTLALVLIGVLMTYSIGSVGEAGSADPRVQMMYVAVGVVVMFVVAHIDYHWLRAPYVYRTLFLASVFLLVLVLIPSIGLEINNARRWLGVFGFRFQPSELAKLTVLILLAVKLTENQKEIASFGSGFLPPMASAACLSMLILLEPDLGMPVMIMTMAFVMVFVAGARWRSILAGVGCGAIAVAVLIITSRERLGRLMTYLDPWRDPKGDGYQLIQSLTAFVRGDIWGQGTGAGVQKLSYLYAAHSDFVFANWAEEMGLAGALVLVALYVALALVALRIAACARDIFGMLLATGISTLILFQTVFIMSVTVGLLPTKGLPLPFISYGGTAMILNLTLMGILLNIGRQAQENEQQTSPGRMARKRCAA